MNHQDRLKEIVAYILSKTGCIHPFRLSRLLALAEIEYFEKHGERLTSATYVKGPGTFYVEGIKELIEGDKCFIKREGDPSRGIKGCIEYTCSPPMLPEKIKEIIDDVIHKYSNLDDMELNKIVMENAIFKRLAKDDES